VNDVKIPDKNDEYFLYQTLVGAFPFVEDEVPFFVERMKNYIIKAIREAKVHTAWLKPDSDYEHGFISFIEEILRNTEDNQFMREFLQFQKKVAYYGIFNSLSQTLIKMTAPGVPDFYQGTELWDLSLVDPDNRRPVDFERRQIFLRDIKQKEQRDVKHLITEVFSTKEDGRIKLFLTYRVLQTRKKHAQLYRYGEYIPIRVEGVHKEHVISFARHYNSTWILTIAPRFCATLIQEGELPIGEGVWANTHLVLPQKITCWKNVITGESIRGDDTLLVSSIFTCFPGALLINKEERS
jgi:(1->4)-alpha-D-glucan 1-alpha-D-glucosylmutase